MATVVLMTVSLLVGFAAGVVVPVVLVGRRHHASEDRAREAGQVEPHAAAAQEVGISPPMQRWLVEHGYRVGQVERDRAVRPHGRPPMSELPVEEWPAAVRNLERGGPRAQPGRSAQ